MTWQGHWPREVSKRPRGDRQTILLTVYDFTIQIDLAGYIVAMNSKTTQHERFSKGQKGSKRTSPYEYNEKYWDGPRDTYHNRSWISPTSFHVMTPLKNIVYRVELVIYSSCYGESKIKKRWDWLFKPQWFKRRVHRLIEYHVMMFSQLLYGL